MERYVEARKGNRGENVVSISVCLGIIHTLLELLPCLEKWKPLGGHRDPLAGLGIAACIRIILFYNEAAETPYLYSLFSFKGLSDGLEYDPHYPISCLKRQSHTLAQFFHQLRFVHPSAPSQSTLNRISATGADRLQKNHQTPTSYTSNPAILQPSEIIGNPPECQAIFPLHILFSPSSALHVSASGFPPRSDDGHPQAEALSGPGGRSEPASRRAQDDPRPRTDDGPHGFYPPLR